ncbi:lipoate--protein ligase [Malassezia nana]|uniref:Putative lipoate-protein ligase A n=1 Tax=Malassezia nana TaxID=180528 RepID=A0AAF0J6S0_9BASI|nr:lipoate--protein ligase [Malassezia nana]
MYVSAVHDPYVHLAWEDFLFRTVAPDVPLCFLYVNEPCVVVGKNQNLWGEVDAKAMRAAQIPIVRRQSGGGSVYHDLGNMNYSFHMPRSTFSRRTHAELVARALQASPVSLPYRFGQPPVFLNARYDLAVYDAGAPKADPAHERKVSGSAYKVAQERAYHHGTLLLHAELSRMSMLKQRRHHMTSKAVPSVPSPVVNLQDTFPERPCTLAPIAEAIHVEFVRKYGATDVCSLDASCLDATATVRDKPVRVRKSYEDMQTWSWLYGTSPAFSVTVPAPPDGQGTLTLHCAQGRVDRVEVHATTGRWADAAQALVGAPYDALAVPPPSVVPRSVWAPLEAPMQAWLERVL